MKISHRLSPTQALSTEIGYNVGHQLSSVTNPRGHVSVRYHYYKYGWDAAGSADGWAAEANTAASQTAERAFSGSGSLKLSLAGVTSTAAGGASRTFATPVSWNRTEQELTAVVWAPAGYALDARLVLTDGRGNVQAGPLTRVEGGAWTAVRLPSAHVDPAHKIAKAEVRLTAPSGAAAYTGPAYVDHLMVRGITAWFQDRSPQHNTVLSHSYDWDGAKTTVKRPNTSGVFQDTTYTYDRYGLTTKTTNPLNKTTDAAYDADLRLIRVTEPDGGTTSIDYYPGSNEVHAVTEPTGETTRQGADTTTGDVRYEMDARNDALRSANKDFVATVYAYDSLGNLTSERVNRYAAGTDLDQNPNAAPLATLRRTTYSYGSGGLVTSMTDPNGNVTRYGYDTSGELTRIEAPAGNGESTSRVTTITRNPDGSVRQMTDPKGQVTNRDYDGLGRLARIDYGLQDGVADFSVSYQADANGNVLTTTDEEGISEYAYDANDRLISESRAPTGQAKRSVTYDYHSNGLPKSYVTFQGKTVSFGYDGVGRLEWQTDPNDLDATGAARRITISYDDESRPVIVTYPSGVSRRLFYGAADDLRLIKLQKADGTVLQSFEYDTGYAADGKMATNYWDGYVRKVTEKTLGVADSAVMYDYDDLGRLVSAARVGDAPYDHRYSYDANGNRTGVTDGGVTTAASYDAANQMTSQGGSGYSYDRNGNLIAYGGNRLVYDAANRWVGGTVNGNSVAFGYNGSGKRVSRTIGTDRTDYWYDATGLALETGAVNAAYLRGPDGSLLAQARDGRSYGYGANHLGSVTAVVGNTGSLEASYSYDPWGTEIASTGSVYNPYRYTSTYLDEATRLYQMGARYYQPGTASFTQADPRPSSVFEGQRYAYTVGENPVNATDPSGLATCRWGSTRDQARDLLGLPIFGLRIDFKYCYDGRSAWLGRDRYGRYAWWAYGWGFFPWNWDGRWNNNRGAIYVTEVYSHGIRSVLWRGRFYYQTMWIYKESYLDVWGSWSRWGRLV